MRATTRLACVSLLVLWSGVALAADLITARAYVEKSRRQGVRVEVGVIPNAENRGYRVALLCGPETSRSTFRQLEGDRSSGPFLPVYFRDLPDCVYTVATELLGPGDRVRARAPLQKVRVGFGGGPDDPQDDLVGDPGPVTPLFD